MHGSKEFVWPQQLQDTVGHDFYSLCNLQASLPAQQMMCSVDSSGSQEHQHQQHFLLLQQAHEQHKQQQQRTGRSPFSVPENQLAQPCKTLARYSCPSFLGGLDHEDLEPEHSQLSIMLSSSWGESSMSFSRHSWSTASVRSCGSNPLHQQLSGMLQLQDHQHSEQQLPHRQLEHGPQYPESLEQLQPADASISTLHHSPCGTASSDYGELCCCSVLEGSRRDMSSMSLATTVLGDACRCTARAGSNCSMHSSGGNSDHSDSRCSSSSPEAHADAAEEAADLLCRTVSVASSNWGSKSQHVASRPAPGGALGNGISWIMPQYGGKEVLADYEFGQTLGCGTFGVTRLVTHRKTASPWACKTICKASIAASPAAQSDVQHEVQILQHLRGHNGIVQLKGVYEDERNIHLVMELCTGGDLLDYISRFGRLQEAEAADVASVMLGTLAHCHRLGVVHRDIKPENFLLGAPTLLSAPAGTAASVLKISDFGVSAFFQPGEQFSEIVGTPFYMAPEVLERCYSHEADIWSAGVVFFLMLAGRLPFDGATDRQIIKAVLDSEPDFDHPAWDHISPAAKDCVSHMLVKDPKRRASVQQLLAHPWLAGRMRSSCCSSAGDRAGAAAGSSAEPAPCSSCDSGSSSRSCVVSWAVPCAAEVVSSPRGRRSSSPTPRKPVLSPLKHVRSRLGDMDG